MLDIYTELTLPLYAILFIQAAVLPNLQALITKVTLDGTKSKLVTVGLNVVAAVLALIGSQNGFSIADLLMLAAPGVFISGNSYDKFWQALRIREYLAPEFGIGETA